MFTKLLAVAVLAAWLNHDALAEESKAAADSSDQDVATCQLLSRGPGVKTDDLGQDLSSFLNDFKGRLEKQDWQGLRTFFHEKSGAKKNIGDQIDAILRNRYQKPWDFSIFRVYEINDSEYRKKLYDCPDLKFQKVISRFGFTKQYFVIMQLMGNNELGRILFHVAPNKNTKLKIIGLHLQQWSHLGKDWQRWSEIGNEHLEKKQETNAFLAYSTAHKLLEGGDFIHYQFRPEIAAEKDKIFSKESFLDKVVTSASNSNIVYAGTLLHQEGTGIFIRVAISKEFSSEDLIEQCRVIGQKLLKGGLIYSSTGGLKCNYIPKGSSPEKDSKIGGYYLSVKDILNVKPKK